MQDFQFATPAPSREERLWDLYRQLAQAGVYVSNLYEGTRWAHMINAWGDHGSQPVPAVKTSLGVTLNYWHDDDGHIRIDGKILKCEEMRHRLRKAFIEWIPGQPTEHSTYTGRASDPSRLSQGRMSADGAARRARAAQVTGRVLLAKLASLFDLLGTLGPIAVTMGDHPAQWCAGHRLEGWTCKSHIDDGESSGHRASRGKVDWTMLLAVCQRGRSCGCAGARSY